jgi:hypothetical protein
LAKNSFSRPSEEARGFSLLARPPQVGVALQAAEKLSEADVLKGHGFIRADKSNKMAPALAAEGCIVVGAQAGK